MNMTKKIMILLMVFVMLLCHPFCVQAEGEEDETQTIQARFYTLTTDKNTTINVKFNPQWFDHTAKEYNHDLAKLSLGLATSAFRPKHADGSATDENLSMYLYTAGFYDLRSDDYNKDPSKYTISTVMGPRTIEGKDGPFDIIGVGVCGQGYVDEWESNFMIGDIGVHVGFDNSARLVYDRIFGYIASMEFEHPLKIWISGFSRAAAVSNIVAARLSDSSVFGEDNVFAYTFATPRTATTVDESKYHNIFNIIGKADPVPKVPFEEWGYKRYGVDLYTPILETDSDFEAKRVKANVIYKMITGIDYWYNREANETINNILSLFLQICPTSAEYAYSLEDKLIHIWENKDPIHVLAALLEIAKDPVLINENTREEANALMNYLTLLIRDYNDQDSVFRSWNDSATAGANILQAHTPEFYVSWVFSADSGEELFTDFYRYNVVHIDSGVKVTLYQGNKLIESIDPIIRYDKETDRKIVLVPKKDRKNPEGNIYLSYREDEILAVLPQDNDYTLSLKTTDNEEQIVLFAYGNTIHSGVNQDLNIIVYLQEANDVFNATIKKDGSWDYSSKAGLNEQNFSAHETELNISDVIITSRQHYFDMTWRQAVILSISLVLFILSLFVFYNAYLIGRIRYMRRIRKGWIRKDSKYSALPLLCATGIFLLFLIMEFFAALFPSNRQLLVFYKLAIGALAILMAYVGYHKKNTPLHWAILISMCLFTWADIVTTYQLNAGTLLHIAAYILLTYVYIKEEQPDKRQYILYGVFVIIALIITAAIKGEYGVLRLLAFLYLASVLAMIVASFPMPRRVFGGSLLLFAGGIFLMINQVRGTTFLSHILSLGTYYLAIVTLAGLGLNTGVMKKGVSIEEEDQ